MKKKLTLFCLAVALALTGTSALFAAQDANWKTIVEKENSRVKQQESGGVLGVHVGKQMERVKTQRQHKMIMNTRLEKQPAEKQKKFLKDYEKVEKAFAKNPLFAEYVLIFPKPEKYDQIPFAKLIQFAEGNANPHEVDTNYSPETDPNLNIVRLFFYDGETILVLHIDAKNKIVSVYTY